MKYTRLLVGLTLPALIVALPGGCGGDSGSNKIELPHDGGSITLNGDGSNMIDIPDVGTVTLSVEPPSATQPVGRTQAFKAFVTGNDGGRVEVTDHVAWSSSDQGIATIDAATGVATAKSAGTVVIKASRANVVATATFTVTSATSSVDASTDGSTGSTADAAAEGSPGSGNDASPTGPTTRIYVSNLGGEGVTPSIQMFAIDAHDDAIPVAALDGPNTTLLGPSQMAVAGNELFVANGEGRGILVFDVHANGDVAPLRTITGNNTTFSNYSPMGLILRGNSLFVSDGNQGLLVFPASGSGDIAPTRKGPTFIYGAHMSSSTVANEVLVAVQSPSSEVRGYLDTATATDAPLRVLTPGKTWARGVTSTPNGIFIATAGLVGSTSDAAITVFAPDAKTGDAPLRAIAGPTNTGLSNPHGISVYGGEIFVSNQEEHAVRIFDEAADGDVLPKRIIKGASTGLKFPSGLLIATTGN